MFPVPCLIKYRVPSTCTTCLTGSHYCPVHEHRYVLSRSSSFLCLPNTEQGLNNQTQFLSQHTHTECAAGGPWRDICRLWPEVYWIKMAYPTFNYERWFQITGSFLLPENCTLGFRLPKEDVRNVECQDQFPTTSKHCEAKWKFKTRAKVCGKKGKSFVNQEALSLALKACSLTAGKLSREEQFLLT